MSQNELRDKLKEAIGWYMDAPARRLVHQVIADLDRIEAAQAVAPGGGEAAIGWKACRRQLFALCEHTQEMAGTEPFERGRAYEAKHIAKAMNAFGPEDCDELRAAMSAHSNASFPDLRKYRGVAEMAIDYASMVATPVDEDLARELLAIIDAAAPASEAKGQEYEGIFVANAAGVELPIRKRDDGKWELDPRYANYGKPAASSAAGECNRNCDCVGECKAGNDSKPVDAFAERLRADILADTTINAEQEQAGECPNCMRTLEAPCPLCGRDNENEVTVGPASPSRTVEPCAPTHPDASLPRQDEPDDLAYQINLLEHDGYPIAAALLRRAARVEVGKSQVAQIAYDFLLAAGYDMDSVPLNIIKAAALEPGNE